MVGALLGGSISEGEVEGQGAGAERGEPSKVRNMLCEMNGFFFETTQTPNQQSCLVGREHNLSTRAHQKKCVCDTC